MTTIRAAVLETPGEPLRLEEVQPPKTAAVQSCWISFPARSANFVGSLAPSSLTT